MDVCDLWIVSTLQSLIDDQLLWATEKKFQEKKVFETSKKKRIIDWK